ncbi:MAG: B12-binding domain-containing radical SAM protein [Candidatus Omnitrophica bacterium]|nr:B12-binding domain-containing radical SAM protein [Candidatus Omnitrophota bacterium]
MKILFANPPTFKDAGSFFRPVRFPTYNYATPVMHPPLYLAYAAAYIRKQGHDVDLIDAPANASTVNDFIDMVKKIAPDILVFETSTPSFSNDCRVAQKVKDALYPRMIHSVFLGTHVTALPHDALAHKAVDVIVLGEYEFSLEEYIKKGPVDTPGIGYRDAHGSIIINVPRPFCEELDVLPPPARNLLPNYKYFDPILKNPFTFVLSGRGCPYPCTFCNWPLYLTGRTFRKRNPIRIVDELEEIQKNYTFQSVLFNDDTFTADRDHAIAVAREIMKRRLTIPWGCYTRADCNDDELLSTLRQAGCFLLKIGIESADEKILKNIKKGYELHNVRSAVEKMLRYKFHVHGTFAFGLPGETHETIKKTVHFAKTLNLSTVQFSIAVPYPGTEFYNYLDTHGFLLTKNWDDYMPLKPIYEYPHLSHTAMHSALRNAYRSHYLRPKYFFVGMKQLLSQPKVFVGNAKKLLTLISSHEKN